MAIVFPNSIEEMAENPHKYGLPTFEEFCKNKEFWVGRKDDGITAIDRGDPILGCKQRYFVEQYEVRSLEQAERVASDMGKCLFTDFKVDPQLKPDQDGKFFNEVRFRVKSVLE